MNKRDTLLLACGQTENRQILRALFRETYNLLEADNSLQAVLLLEQNRDCIAAVLLDVTVPEKIDREVFARAGRERLLVDIPVIVAVESDDPKTLDLAFGLGAADVIGLSYDPYAMLRRVQNIVELYVHKRHLEELVEEQAADLRHTNERMVDALSSIIEHRSAESGQHIMRIRGFTRILLTEVARSCPEYGLTEQTVLLISGAAALHDVGKISIPDAILNKPGPLTAAERAVMQNHALAGCEILESLSDVGTPEYLRYAYNICRYHHERWDGGGYPEGISGDDIPICAQVVGLADVYDALTSKRVYKDAYALDTAANMILNGECGVFSPKLLACFKHVGEQFEQLARDYGDGLSPRAERFDAQLPGPAKDPGANALEAVQAKYMSLLHYVDAFVAEVDPERNIYHLRYNPYPELAALRDATGMEDAIGMLVGIACPDEQEHVQQLFSRAIPSFLQEGLRRQTHRIRVRGMNGGDEVPCDMTFLRPRIGADAGSELLLLWKKVDGSPRGAGVNSDVWSSPVLDGAYWCRNDSHFTLVGSAAGLERMIGYTDEEIRRRFCGHMIDLIHEQDRETVAQEIRRQLQQGTDYILEYRMTHRGGSVIWVTEKGRLVTGEDGQEYIYCALMDTTESRRSYDVLRQQLERYEIILAQTENVLFDWNLRDDTIIFSETWERIFGFKAIRSDVIRSLSTGSYFHPDDLPLLLKGIRELRQGGHYRMTEVRVATGSGRYLWCRFRASAVRGCDGELERIVGVIINIDSEKRAEQLLQDRAERDTLTKLLNKQAGAQRAEQYIARQGRDLCCALLIIDLDNFKYVNDRYGHMFGDAVLAQVAREIRRLFRSQDIVSRIGGDEFMVVMCDTADRELVEARCRMVLEIVGDLFRDQTAACPLGCSIGVALAPEHGHVYADLFKHADAALYKAKNRGKNTLAFYDEEGEQLSGWRGQLTAVSGHIDSDEQPGLADGSIVQYAFRRLYTASDTVATVNEILALIGQQMNVSRVYIFENTPDNRFCNNTFEWCNTGIEPQIDNLQGICYETDIPGYVELYNEHGIFYCQDIGVLPRPVYDVVAPQGIKSMLHCAIRDKGVFRGYIGFDECEHTRLWTREQIDVLSFFSEMLSIFLLKKRAQDEIAQRANDMRSILDNQNAWIYVIDPESCRLQFLNAATRALAPSVREGDYCYRDLMGRSERCPGCPAEHIVRDKTARTCLVNQRFGITVNAEATLINWGGEEACLLICRESEKTDKS